MSAEVAASTDEPRRADVGRRLVTAYYVALLILLFLPIGVLFLYSFSSSPTLTFPPAGLTLDSYGRMFDNEPLLRSARNSLLVGVVAATAATVLATMLALAIVRFTFRGRSALLGLAMLPLVVPYIILAVSQFLLFRAAGVTLSIWTVAAAHTVVALPFAFLIVLARLTGMERSTEEAAMDLGASRLAAIRLVVLPVIAPSLVAAWIVAFTISFDEFALALFLAGTEPTFPVYLIGQLRFANQLPVLIALAVLLMVGTLVLILIAERLRRAGSLRFRRASA
jgi:spermidine/putrescine transport system permease protein